ncbi:ferredoxin-like protein [Desulfocucumis palustris]|uniref:Ferredoxin-like protein n=1 Tax=Desulfocucumis palustris TaxID=1898651 RepID=A0A2L2XGT1_9FIRM|nr:ferredoxin family protein [Desulfocucumis palustris]GBF34923.1 ferredoxin-like protein [Desulfocucumis palustris]
MKRLTIEQLLGINKFAVDDDQAHIIVKKEICALCLNKPCTFACPANLYKLKDGQISFDYAGCLECGTCRAICPQATAALSWQYPRGGFGVNFRYG